MKKGLSLLLSFLMVISMLSCLSVVASAATSDYAIDTEYTVSNGTEGVFVVPEEGYYAFGSDGEGDPRLRLYSADGEELAYWNNYSACLDFYGVIHLEADQQVTCKFYDNDDIEFVFTITKIVDNIDSISIELTKPLKCIFEKNGHWSSRYNSQTQDYEEYFYYNEPDLGKKGDVLTLNYTDGTSEKYVYSKIEYSDGDWIISYWDWVNEDGKELPLPISESSDQAQKPWTLGDENYFTISYMSKSCQVPVSVIENPVESIQYVPKYPEDYRYLKEDDGHWSSRYNSQTQDYEEYFYYYTPGIYSGDTLVVNYKDNTSVTYTYGSIYVYDEDDDCWHSGWFSEEGEALDTSFTGVSYSANQSSQPWTVDGENFITYSYMYTAYKYPVTIFENPVESIEFIPVNGSVSVMENTKGYWHDHWDENFEQWVDDCFYYYADNILEKDGNAIKVNYIDGTTDIFTYNVDEYDWVNADGESIDGKYFEISSEQSETSYWTVGGNNVATVGYYGKTVDVNVNVINAIPDVTDGNFVAEVISETECYIIEASTQAIVNGVLTIPETIGGYIVTGMDFWDFYEFSGVSEIKEINIPSGFNTVSKNEFYSYYSLEKINVADGNKKYTSINGVLYNKAKTRIVYCPLCFSGELYIPAEATEVDITALQALKEGSTLAIDNNNTSFAFEDGILYNADYTKIIKAISLPENYVMKDTVKEIGDFAFSGNSTVKTVTLNNNVTKLSYGAFYNCTSLEAAPLPEGLVSIEEAAFRGSGIKSLTLPSTVTRIYADAFRDCKNLSEVNLNEGLKSFGKSAFKNSGITSLVIPDSVKDIGYYTFQNCDSLVNVVIGSGITGLWGENFAFCDSLKEINIPATVERFNQSTVDSCSSLERINVDSDNSTYSSIDGVFFNKAGSELLVYPGGRAGEYTIPLNVTTIAWSAFKNASRLTRIIISEGVRVIDPHAFGDCTSLEYVYIPESVEEIYGSTFFNCDNLKCFEVAKGNKHYKSIDGALYSYGVNYQGENYCSLIAYPVGINTDIVVPDGVTGVILGCWDTITSVALPESVEHVYFAGCTSLTSINIPDAVTFIAYETFKGCSSLKRIALPSYITSIEFCTFEDCVSLEAIEIPASVTRIDYSAFNNCVSLKDVYYTGTEEQWNAIGIGGGNECLTNATIHFNSFMPEEVTAPELKVINGQWVYAMGNNIVTDYTGLVEYYGTYYYVENGYLNWGYTGLAPYGSDWYYVTNGVLDWTYTGLTEYYGSWYYVQNGYLNWSYTGLTEYYGGWYYVAGGVLDWGYTGLAEYYGTYYYVENGMYKSGYTGLAAYGSDWYYVKNGVLDWSYTGLVEYYGTYYYVENGFLDWGYTGLAPYGSDWYFVTNGVLDWSYTGLTEYFGSWYYVENGHLNWSYTGLANHYGTWYYVAGGVLDWNYTGLAAFGGTYYYVANGVLDWGYTGLAPYYGEYYYVTYGLIDWGYTGYVDYYGGRYYITNGYLDWSLQ